MAPLQRISLPANLKNPLNDVNNPENNAEESSDQPLDVGFQDSPSPTTEEDSGEDKGAKCSGIDYAYSLGIDIGEEPNCTSQQCNRMVEQYPYTNIPEGSFNTKLIYLKPGDEKVIGLEEMGMKEAHMVFLTAKCGDFLLSINSGDWVRARSFFLDSADPPYADTCSGSGDSKSECGISHLTLANYYPEGGVNIGGKSLQTVVVKVVIVGS